MSRPLRIEFAGALYHLTSRGDGQEAIFLGDLDREQFLALFGEVCERFKWACHAYCLMGNHYHLLVETLDGKLSQGMRQLNGVYTQRFNRRHARVGHVFQGRFNAILVDRDRYLVAAARYIVLNPVRAQLVHSAQEWPWSSYRATSAQIEAPAWLDTNRILSMFGSTRRTAIEGYREFVTQHDDLPPLWEGLRNQIYLGDGSFVEGAQRQRNLDEPLGEVPRIQQRPLARPLPEYERESRTRNEAIARAFRSGTYSQKELADHFRLHYSRVSKIIANCERERIKT